MVFGVCCWLMLLLVTWFDCERVGVVDTVDCLHVWFGL